MTPVLSTNDREDHQEILKQFQKRIVATRIDGTKLVLGFEDGDEVTIQGTSTGLVLS
jgi:hypothetical protein